MGDGTTSVIILAGELLDMALPLVERDMHPTVIVRAYNRAMEHCLKTCESISTVIENRKDLHRLVMQATSHALSLPRELITDIAIKAVETVTTTVGFSGTTRSLCSSPHLSLFIALLLHFFFLFY